MSQAGLAIVRAFEGCLKPIGGGKFKPYICPAGVLTIGWGHTNHHGRKFSATDVWTQKECDDELASDMVGFERAVLKHVKVPLAQHQFDALVSFTYNCGEGNLLKSTLLKKVNTKEFAGAAAEFAKWNKGDGKVLPGLTRRRRSEALLFAGDDSGALAVAGAARLKPIAMPQQVDAPKKAPARTGSAVVVGGGAAVAAKKVSDTYGPTLAVALIAAVLIAGFIAWRFWPKKEG
jgi:lysozyme